LQQCLYLYAIKLMDEKIGWFVFAGVFESAHIRIVSEVNKQK